MAWLKDARAEGTVIGGVAASLLGRPRMTADLDLVVLVPEERWGAFVERGRRHGIAAAEDMIVMKSLALRPRDIADIESMLEAHPELDLERVRSTLRGLSELLEGPDHVAELDAIVRRTRRT